MVRLVENPTTPVPLLTASTSVSVLTAFPVTPAKHSMSKCHFSCRFSCHFSCHFEVQEGQELSLHSALMFTYYWDRRVIMHIYDWFFFFCSWDLDRILFQGSMQHWPHSPVPEQLQRLHKGCLPGPGWLRLWLLGWIRRQGLPVRTWHACPVSYS